MGIRWCNLAKTYRSSLDSSLPLLHRKPLTATPTPAKYLQVPLHITLRYCVRPVRPSTPLYCTVVLPARNSRYGASPPTILATSTATLTCTIRDSLLLHDFPTLLSPTHNFVSLPPYLPDGCKRASGFDPKAYRADADCGLE